MTNPSIRNVPDSLHADPEATRPKKSVAPVRDGTGAHTLHLGQQDGVDYVDDAHWIDRHPQWSRWPWLGN